MRVQLALEAELMSVGIQSAHDGAKLPVYMAAVWVMLLGNRRYLGEATRSAADLTSASNSWWPSQSS